MQWKEFNIDPTLRKRSHLPARRSRLEIIGDREKLAQWRHKMKGPAFYRLGRKIIYRGSDLNAWMAANRVDPSKNA